MDSNLQDDLAAIAGSEISYEEDAVLTPSSSLPGIPDHRAPSALRGQPRAQDLPHAHLCTQRGRCQVTVLVLPWQAPKDQEGERRDRLRKPGA